MPQASAVVSVQNWHRRKWDESGSAVTDGAKVFRLEVTLRYTGEIDGESSMQCLITQNEDGTGNLVALEKVIGSVAGKSGSFVLRHIGDFDGGAIRRTLTVMPGTGTGDLRGIDGEAQIDLYEHDEEYPIVFNFDM